MQITPSGRPPFRADHIGSLLRPRSLRDAFRQHAGGGMNDHAFREAQDAAIRDVVKRQRSDVAAASALGVSQGASL
jgi:5-methyltetrahydropteroyltriglutamate--homocysteine methyltransferase